MNEFEKQLRQLSPTGLQATEPDVMYRCGWEAAIASMAPQDEDELLRERRSWNWLASFIGGTAVGLAAALLVMLSIGTSIDGSNDSTKIAEQVDEGERSRTGSVDNPDFNSATQSKTTQGFSDQIALASGNANQAETSDGFHIFESLENVISVFVNKVELEQPIKTPTVEPEFREVEVLSPAARRNWNGTLSVADNFGSNALVPDAHSVSFESKTETLTLGELLFGSSGKDFY